MEKLKWLWVKIFDILGSKTRHGPSVKKEKAVSFVG